MKDARLGEVVHAVVLRGEVVPDADDARRPLVPAHVLRLGRQRDEIVDQRAALAEHHFQEAHGVELADVEQLAPRLGMDQHGRMRRLLGCVHPRALQRGEAVEQLTQRQRESFVDEVLVGPHRVAAAGRARDHLEDRVFHRRRTRLPVAVPHVGDVAVFGSM